jgi:hypothetical protein
MPLSSSLAHLLFLALYAGPVVPATGRSRAGFGEHLSRDRDLGRLKGYVLAMADDLRADLDQLQAPACARWVVSRNDRNGAGRAVPARRLSGRKGSDLLVPGPGREGSGIGAEGEASFRPRDPEREVWWQGDEQAKPRSFVGPRPTWHASVNGCRQADVMYEISESAWHLRATPKARRSVGVPWTAGRGGVPGVAYV